MKLGGGWELRYGFGLYMIPGRRWMLWREDLRPDLCPWGLFSTEAR